MNGRKTALVALLPQPQRSLSSGALVGAAGVPAVAVTRPVTDFAGELDLVMGAVHNARFRPHGEHRLEHMHPAVVEAPTPDQGTVGRCPIVAERLYKQLNILRQSNVFRRPRGRG